MSTDEEYLFIDESCTLEDMCRWEDVANKDGVTLDWDDIIEVDGGMKVRIVPL